jgi:hypothetical protein
MLLTMLMTWTPSKADEEIPASGAVVWSGNGHWYEVVSVEDGITWEEANLAAVAMGGYLATITSQEENDFVFGLVDEMEFWSISGYDAVGPWLGGLQPPNSLIPGQDWHWVTGEPWQYTNWCSGINQEPNDHWGTEEDRLHFYQSAYNPQPAPTWNDIPGSSRLPSYVVEGSAVPEPSALLVWSGLGLIGAVMRYRRKRRAD